MTKTKTLAREFSVKTKLVDVVEMYGGEVTLEFDASRHIYTAYDEDHQYPNGRKCQSVTGILEVLSKPALIGWAAKQCSLYLERTWEPDRAYTREEIAAISKNMKGAYRKIKEGAADVGTDVHAWIESHIKDCLGIGEVLKWPEDKQVREAIGAYLEWESEHKVKYLHSEFRVYSRRYHYAGTSDIDAEIDGQRSIADLKSSNGIWPEMGMQLAGYQQAREEEGYGPYEQRWIIRCGKDGVLETRQFTDYAGDLEGFLAAQKLSRWLAGTK